MDKVKAMDNLLEKTVNCYINYINRVNCGVTNQEYGVLYDAILLLKENIDEPQYIEYFYNKLLCPINLKLEKVDTMERIIGHTISPSENLLPSFDWNELYSPELRTYSVAMDEVGGYNFAYVSTPPDVNVAIYDAMNNLLFNSNVPGDYQFELAGTVTTSEGQENIVYRKKNVYNTRNSVTFNIDLF